MFKVGDKVKFNDSIYNVTKDRKKSYTIEKIRVSNDKDSDIYLYEIPDIPIYHTRLDIDIIEMRKLKLKKLNLCQ